MNALVPAPCPTYLGVALHDLRHQVEAVAHGDGGLAREQPHPHQRQPDPGQPVLARLAVSVEERPYTLRREGHSEMIYHRYSAHSDVNELGLGDMGQNEYLDIFLLYLDTRYISRYILNLL